MSLRKRYAYLKQQKWFFGAINRMTCGSCLGKPFRSTRYLSSLDP